jgi:hypothetical protein
VLFGFGICAPLHVLCQVLGNSLVGAIKSVDHVGELLGHSSLADKVDSLNTPNPNEQEKKNIETMRQQLKYFQKVAKVFSSLLHQRLKHIKS